MTQTTVRARPQTPARPRPRPRAKPRRQRGSVVVSGCISALTAMGLGLLVSLTLVLVGWVTDAHSSGTAVSLVRSAGQLWLLAHHTPLEIPGGHLVVAPLTLTAALLVLVGRSAVASIHRTRARRRRDALVAALAVAPPYALLSTVVSAAARTPAVRPVTTAALGCTLLFAFVAAFAGALSERGWRTLIAGLPRDVAAVVAATATAVASLLMIGAVAVAISLGSDVGTAADLSRSVARGAPSGLALLIAQLAVVPNAVVWGSAYAVGSGFAVGVGTHARPSGSSLDAVPSVPLFAALPAGGDASVLQWIALSGAVVAAGVITALVLSRRLPVVAPHVASAYLLAVAVSAGIAMAVLCWLAGGSGPGRLATLGPSPLVTAAAVTVWIALAGVPAAWLAAWRAQRSAGVIAPAE